MNALGFDPLLSMPSLEEFRGMLAEQQRQIKVVLMDQVCFSHDIAWQPVRLYGIVSLRHR